jgi:hypothetical protein
MERLDPELRRELGRLGTPEHDLAALVAAWPEAVGETIARNAWPARLARDGTLHVNTSSAPWAFELGRLAGELLERLGPLAPKALRFAPGPLPALDRSAAGDPAAPDRPPEPTVEERAAAATLAASIEDAELRELVARAAAASLARGRSRRRVW